MKKILIFAIIFLTTSCTTTKTTLIENGREGKGNLKNNLKQGKWIFYKDGKINSIGNYSKNKMDGIWRYYHPNEKLHQKGKFVNDKQNGIWNYYFESGEFMGEGELVNDLQVGIWKWYHKNGKLYTERYYEDGKLMEIKSCFDKNGEKLDCGNLSNGNGYLLGHDLNNETDKIEKSEYKEGIYIKNYR